MLTTAPTNYWLKISTPIFLAVRRSSVGTAASALDRPTLIWPSVSTTWTSIIGCSGQSISGFATNELSEYVVTVEPSFTTHTLFRGYQLSWTFAAMYISDMPTIVHAAGAPATLDTDDALTFNAMIRDSAVTGDLAADSFVRPPASDCLETLKESVTEFTIGLSIEMDDVALVCKTL